MLVLTRKKGESIRIGDGVIVKVLENSGKQVEIGINVAREVPVYREEIYEKIQKDNKKAILQNNSGLNSLENLIKIKKKYKHKKQSSMGELRLNPKYIRKFDATDLNDHRFIPINKNEKNKLVVAKVGDNRHDLEFIKST